MLEWLKNELVHALLFLNRFITCILSFFYYVIRHPIDNISVWAVLILFTIINTYMNISIDGKEMFLLSVGLVSIMTFISTYLESHTIDIDKKENFYLGFNIKKRNFHDNFWLKKFNDIPIKLFFWIIAICPVVIVCSKVESNTAILRDMLAFVVKNNSIITSIWLSIFTVTCFYCAAILIESVSLSRMSFSKSYLYSSSKRVDKYIIDNNIENQFREEFIKIFKFDNIFEQDNKFYSNVNRLIEYIFNRGTDVSNNDMECDDYVGIAFRSERDVIGNLLSKVCIHNNNTITNRIIVSIRHYLIKIEIEKLNRYYTVKWIAINSMRQDNITALSILKIACFDLGILIEIEEKLNSNDDYKDIFWGQYIKIKHQAFLNNNMPESNLCISLIVDILEEQISNIDFLCRLENAKYICLLLDRLNEIDKKIIAMEYFPSVFTKIYSYTIDEESKNIKAIKGFMSNINPRYAESYMLNEAAKQSKNILMSGRDLSAKQIEYLLGFMKLEGIICTLIYRLAYCERSHQEIMNIEEFSIWKNCINYRITKGEDVGKLKQNNYIQELCTTIRNSHVSHFIFEGYLKWLWDSLFEEFNDEKLNEFNELGFKGIRRDFSLKSYVILRLIMNNTYHNKFLFSNFSSSNMEQIKIELPAIATILENEGIFI